MKKRLGRPPTLRQELWVSAINVKTGGVTARELGDLIGKNPMMIRDALEWLVDNKVFVKIRNKQNVCLYFCVKNLYDQATQKQINQMKKNLMLVDRLFQKQINQIHNEKLLHYAKEIN